MTILSKAVILHNAKSAKEVLTEFRNPVPFFHIRPTSGGVTFVTTYPAKAMRGITEIPPARAGQMLRLAQSETRNDTVDFSKIHYIRKTGRVDEFPERMQKSLSEKQEKEFAVQSFIINKIVDGDESLIKKFNVENLFFAGSEIIWQETVVSGGMRLDILAHDGKGKILFLELKDERNTGDDPCGQVREYVNNYGNDDEFKKLLLNYPAIPEIRKISSVEGWVVIGNCEDLDVEKVKVRRAI
jgi:hypothetical protein